MSFPRAIALLQQMGVTPDTATPDQAREALLGAMMTDTKAGFDFLAALVIAGRERVGDALTYMRERLPEHADAILRFEWINDNTGLKVDVAPDSVLGRQLGRLMGTDSARPLLAEHLESNFGFANCCGVIAGDTPGAVAFTPADQIRWQFSIDC